MPLDLTNEGVFATNRSHILDLVTLARRDETINLFQGWREKHLLSSSDEERSRIRFASSLGALFLELENELTRKWDTSNGDKVDDDKKISIEEVKKILISTDQEPKPEDLIKIFFKMSFILDDMNLTRRDKIRNIDTKNIEEVNKNKGL